MLSGCVCTTGYTTPDEEGADGAAGGPNPAAMTIPEIKDWLTTNRHENRVWEGMQAKAKKAQWIQIMKSVL